jgi:Leucine-rich repeat (LRR) protein
LFVVVLSYLRFFSRLELNLSGNQFRFLPTEIGLLENLTLFDLSGNQLETLPEEFPDMFRYVLPASFMFFYS